MARLIFPRDVIEVQVSRIIDGDTIDFTPAVATRVRLLGLDAAEIRGASDEEELIGGLQTGWVDDWIKGRRLVCDGRGEDNFGRVLAWIFDADTGECLNLDLVKKWPERARNPRKEAQRIFGEEPENYDQYKLL